MASRVSSSSLPASSLRFQISERLSTKSNPRFINPNTADKKPSFPCRAAQSENFAEEQSVTESSARSQLDLLEQLTSNTGRGYESAGETTRPTIREQLAELTRGREEDFTLQLGKKMKENLKRLNILTISQRRNIKRQAYLNEVGGRNDAAFFAAIGAFVILPPLVILAECVFAMEIQAWILVGREGCNGGDGCSSRADPAPPIHHLIYFFGASREEGLNRAISPVPDPTAEAKIFRVLHRPVSEPYTLHPSLYFHPHGFHDRSLRKIT